MRIVKTTILLCNFVLAVSAHPSCSIEIDEERSQINLQLDWLRVANSVPGIPGKRGPVGEKGDRGVKGFPGPKGECSTEVLEELQDQIQNLKRKDRAQEVRLKLLIERNDQLFIASNGNLYWVSTNQMHWTAAKTYCEANGAQLACEGIRDSQVWPVLFNKFTPRYWVGLSDVENEGQWQWIDGIESDASTPWFSDEPNDGGNGENCGIAWTKDGVVKLNDYVCSRNEAALCELIL